MVPRKIWPLCGVLLALTWLAMWPATAASQPALSPPAHKALSAVHELLQEDRRAEAELAIEEVLARFAEKPLAVATARQLQGFLFYETGRAEPALEAFDAALAHDALPPETRRQLLYNTAQLLLELERPQAAVARIEAWLATDGAGADTPTPRERTQAAWIYLAAQRYRPAIDHLLAAIAAAEEPEEAWYRLLINAGQGAEDWPALRRWLGEIVARYPDNKQYWQQLASVHLQLGEEKKAAAALGTAHHNNLLNQPEEILRLVRLRLFTGVPQQAAVALQQALSDGRVPATAANYELLADSWQLAKEEEQAIAALRQALEQDGGPPVALKLGRLLIHRDAWQDALPHLQRASTSKAEKIQGEAWLLLGMAHYQQEALAEARSAFQRAAKITAFRRQADNWLQHLAGS